MAVGGEIRRFNGRGGDSFETIVELLKKILVLNFPDECAAVGAHSRLRNKKLLTSFIKCFSM